jgi:hypothetical protein
MTEEIKLPKELRIKKKQNPDCNLKEGSLCGLYCGIKDLPQEVCLKIILDENNNFSGFEMVPCRWNREKKIKVEL